MASVTFTLDATKLLEHLHATLDEVTIVRLAELLNLPPSEAQDWLVYKVAQFRGVSEADVRAMLVFSRPVDMQSGCRG